jgi:hypothetical protein
MFEIYAENVTERRVVSMKLQKMDAKERAGTQYMTPMQQIQDKSRRLLMKELVAHPAEAVLSKMPAGMDEEGSAEED